MKELFFTVTGLKHYYGMTPFRPGKKIRCTKEPENPHDSEAIRCHKKHIGTIGYVANSVYTVIPGTRSAGSLGGHVKQKFTAEVLFLTEKGAICRVCEGQKEKKKPAEEAVPEPACPKFDTSDDGILVL